MLDNILQEKIIDNDTISVWHYPNENIVHHQVHKFVYGEKIREALMAGLEIFEKKGCKKWLSDDRNNPSLRKADIDWSMEIWVPRMAKAGWKFWAIVMPERATGKMSMRHIIENFSKEGIIVEIFDDENKAFEWLDSKP